MAKPLLPKREEESKNQDFARIAQTLNATLSNLQVASDLVATRFDRIASSAEKFDSRFQKVISAFEKFGKADAGFILRRTTKTGSSEFTDFQETVVRDNWARKFSLESRGASSRHGGGGGGAANGQFVPSSHQNDAGGAGGKKARTFWDSNRGTARSDLIGPAERAGNNTQNVFRNSSTDIGGQMAFMQVASALGGLLQQGGSVGAGMLGRPLALASPNAAATLGGSADMLLQSIGTKLIPTVADFSVTLQNASKVVDKWDSSTVDTTVKMSLLALGVGVLIPVLARLASAATFAASMVSKVGVGLGGGFGIGSVAVAAGASAGFAAGNAANNFLNADAINQRSHADARWMNDRAAKGVIFDSEGDAYRGMSREDVQGRLDNARASVARNEKLAEENKPWGPFSLFGSYDLHADYTKRTAGNRVEAAAAEKVLKQMDGGDPGFTKDPQRDDLLKIGRVQQSAPGISGLDSVYDKMTIGGLRNSPLDAALTDKSIAGNRILEDQLTTLRSIDGKLPVGTR